MDPKCAILDLMLDRYTGADHVNVLGCVAATAADGWLDTHRCQLSHNTTCACALLRTHACCDWAALCT